MSAPAFLHSAYASLRTQTRDLLLLESAERRVRSFAPSQQKTLRSLYEAATNRASVADDLTDARTAVAALILYREAAELLIRAVLVSRDADRDLAALDSSDAWKELAPLLDAGELGPLPAALDEARTVLTAEGRLALDELSPDELMAKRAAVEATVAWLRSQLEPRTLSDIRWSRILRLAGVGAIVVALLAWGITKLGLGPNIALHKPVTASSRHPASVAPPDNSGLVDGVVEATYGIHTNKEPSSWVMVDLQDVYKIAKVKVYNRGDGWFDDGLPFQLEFSENGKDFAEVDKRTQPFTQSSPWTYAAGGRRTRYVRIKTPGYVALSELEIYGKK